jgi:hypothetical protein
MGFHKLPNPLFDAGDMTPVDSATPDMEQEICRERVQRLLKPLEVCVMRVFLSLLLGVALALVTNGVKAESESAVDGDERHFDGPYVGFEAGVQNVFAGSFINQVDVLAQKSRAVAGLFGGWRWQFGSGWVLGVEGQFGWVNGDLVRIEANDFLRISYENNYQYGLGMTFGHVVGQHQRWLLFGYVSTTEREFDIAIETPVGIFTQKDRQGFTRFGFGAETRLGEHWNVRGTVGLLSVDFGNQRTNINLEDKVDLMLGVSYSF